MSATTIKKNLAAIVTASVWERTSGYCTCDKEELCDLLGVELIDCDDNDYIPEANRAIIVQAVPAAPEKALLYEVYCDFELVESCFVLRPDKDIAARCALRQYAEVCGHPDLAHDIYLWLRSIEETEKALESEGEKCK